MDSRFGSIDGVIRTRVGYTGGEKENPTYYNLGNHSEAVQVDYDPAKISYEQLLDVFWDSHNPTRGLRSRQYMAAVFYHDDAQKKAAESTMQQLAERLTKKISTRILPLTGFYLAEDYHQKYALRRHPRFANAFNAVYRSTDALINSTAAARVNGYLDGYGECRQLKSEIELLGLSEDLRKSLLISVCRS